MAQNSNHDASPYSRRTVLRTVGGSSAFIGIGLVGSASASDGQEKIVTHKRGDTPVKTKDVPKEWKSHVDTASKAKSELAQNYGNRNDVKTFSLRRADERYGGKHGFTIHVRVTSNQAKDELPDSARGVPTSFSEYIPPKPDGSCYNTGDWDSCPGGVTFNGGGTSGSQFYHDYDGDGNREAHILTAAHLFGDECSDQVGDTATQTNDDWGTVKAHSGPLDAVLCHPNSGFGVDNRIIQQTGDIDVVGHVTKSGLQDMCTNNEYIGKMGKATGNHSGTLEECEYKASTCDDLKGEGVKYSIEAAPGDSGGPVYDTRDGDAYMVAIHEGSWNEFDTDCDGDPVKSTSIGPSAYSIIDTFGGAFIASTL